MATTVLFVEIAFGEHLLNKFQFLSQIVFRYISKEGAYASSFDVEEWIGSNLLAARHVFSRNDGNTLKYESTSYTIKTK